MTRQIFWRNDPAVIGCQVLTHRPLIARPARHIGETERRHDLLSLGFKIAQRYDIDRLLHVRQRPGLRHGGGGRAIGLVSLSVLAALGGLRDRRSCRRNRRGNARAGDEKCSAIKAHGIAPCFVVARYPAAMQAGERRNLLSVVFHAG
jgi:hypothetical protein